MEIKRRFNRFFELYHKTNNWSDLYYYALSLENPSPETIANPIFGLYKEGMACWCKIQYSIWLGDADQHKTFVNELETIYERLCELAGVQRGERILPAVGIKEESELSEMPQVFDIVFGLIVKNKKRHEIINNLFRDISTLEDYSKLDGNLNDKKIEEFIGHYRQLQKNVKKGTYIRHRIEKFVLFKVNAKDIKSTSSAEDLTPFPLDERRQFNIKGLFGCNLDCIVRFDLLRMDRIRGLADFNDSFRLYKVIIEFSCQETFKIYLWSSLFDEDILLQFENDKMFSPIYWTIAEGGAIFKRVNSFDYTLVISQLFDPALLATKLRSFIPFNIGDIGSHLDEKEGRFIIDSQMVIYIQPRGHDTELDLVRNALAKFCQYMSILWIFINEQSDLLISKSGKNILHLKSAFLDINSKLKSIRYTLDINSMFLLEFFELAYNEKQEQSVIANIKYIESLILEDDIKVRKKVEVTILVISILQVLQLLTSSYPIFFSKSYLVMSVPEQQTFRVVTAAISSAFIIAFMIVIRMIFYKKFTGEKKS